MREKNQSQIFIENQQGSQGQPAVQITKSEASIWFNSKPLQFKIIHYWQFFQLYCKTWILGFFNDWEVYKEIHWEKEKWQARKNN